MSRFAILLFLVAAPLAYGKSVKVIPRINGGENADTSKFQYHVAILKINPEDGITRHVCGGAIIHRRYVLTAAHCVHDLKHDEVIVRAGGNEAPPAGKLHHERRLYKRVARVMYPRDYFRDPRYHEYDIAVLKIVGTFDLTDSEHFEKLQLPHRDNDYEEGFATVSGYGVHTPNKDDLDQDGNGFKSLKTKVISTYECQATRAFILTRGSLCTQSIEMKGHTCYGDGGNPLVYDNQIIGVLNDPQTCDSGKPELFTKVSAYLDFIKKILDDRYSSDVMYQ